MPDKSGNYRNSGALYAVGLGVPPSNAPQGERVGGNLRMLLPGLQRRLAYGEVRRGSPRTVSSVHPVRLADSDTLFGEPFDILPQKDRTGLSNGRRERNKVRMTTPLFYAII